MKSQKYLVLCAVGALLLILAGMLVWMYSKKGEDAKVRAEVEAMAKAWETGDDALLDSLLHPDVIFAYPGRRLTKAQALDDLRYFRDAYVDTKVYVHTVIVNGDEVAVEWQFATTNKTTGKREVVSDAIIAHRKDGKFDVWKEYLDGRVKGLQAEGKLELEEGQEPFPWPHKIEIRAE
jgi:ketosteroid isomerase-like protein